MAPIAPRSFVEKMPERAVFDAKDQGYRRVGGLRGRRRKLSGERASRGEYGAAGPMRHTVHELLLMRVLGTSWAIELIVSQDRRTGKHEGRLILVHCYDRIFRIGGKFEHRHFIGWLDGTP
jgi:hypothetical protein